MIIRNGRHYIYRRKNPRLKIAVIMDKFTFECFAPECDILQLTVENFENELHEFAPDFVFVESAWGDINKSWSGKVIRVADEMGKLAIYCAENDLPIVFWNKEDPPFFKTFLSTATIADLVLTTASECIPRYKDAVGHDNVYLMHFAAQPKLHNPVEEYDRLDAFCFAGAYYRQFPERNKIFDELYFKLREFKPFDIYDRFYGIKKRNFPKKYLSDVKGNLPYEKTALAYKGYKYGINLNTVTDSESMFSRRVFELMASNTVVVGNYSKGLRNYFGDLTISSDNPNEIIERIREIESTPDGYDIFREKALKRILSHELYSHRLEFICKILFTDFVPKEQI